MTFGARNVTRVAVTSRPHRRRSGCVVRRLGPTPPVRLTALVLALAAAVPAAAQNAPRDTVRFTPTVGQPTFAVRDPVLRVRPGTVLVSRTMHGAYYTPEGGAFPGEVGPIYVEGA